MMKLKHFYTTVTRVTDLMLDHFSTTVIGVTDLKLKHFSTTVTGVTDLMMKSTSLLAMVTMTGCSSVWSICDSTVALVTKKTSNNQIIGRPSKINRVFQVS